MDRNIKAELVALRSEVLTNLDNIKEVVGKIDDTLKDDTESYVLANCPRLVTLLNVCKKVTLHPRTRVNVVYEFNEAVKNIDAVISLSLNEIAEEKYSKFFDEIIKVSKAVETLTANAEKEQISKIVKSGWDLVRNREGNYQEPSANNDVFTESMSSETIEEDYRITKIVKTEESDLDQMRRLAGMTGSATEPAYGTERKVFHVDTGNLSVDKAKSVIEQLKTEIHDREPVVNSAEIDDSNTDELAVNKDHKKDPHAWDASYQDRFVREWEDMKHDRINIVDTAIRETLHILLNYNGDIYVSNVANLKESQELTIKFARVDEAKRRIALMLTAYNRDALVFISKNSDPSNFVKFYDWLSDIKHNLNEIGKSDDQSAVVVRYCYHTLSSILEKKEIEFYKSLADSTEEVPGISGFMPHGYEVYMNELNNAFKWLSEAE